MRSSTITQRTVCATAIAVFGGIHLFAQFVPENAVIRWDKLQLQIIRTLKPGPPMNARALAMVHTAIFDAWAAYDPVAVGTMLGGSLRRPASEATLVNKNRAIAYAAHDVLVDLYPSQKSAIDLQLISYGGDPADQSTDTTTPAGIGHAVAKAILDFRHNDGSNQLNGYADTTGYQPLNTPTTVNDPNHWQPLAVPDGKGGFTQQKYLAPHWGNVIPFAMTTGSQFRPDLKLPQYGSKEYLDQATQLLSYSALLTDTQKMIAEYWADGPASETPPGHWCLLAQDISKRDNHTLDDDVKMYFALTNAVMDASIAAWDAKRAYDSVRPITAIQYAFKGKTVMAWGGPSRGTLPIDGGTWQPYQAANFVTPPFPEYLSGHSTFSAASAEILKSFTGSDTFGKSVTFKAGSSLFESGVVPAADVTLSWSTFSEAADEAGISRRYGGIHFPQADLDARKLGRTVGMAVWQKAQTYINGTAGRAAN